MEFLPKIIDSTKVVPLPTKGSSTVSPFLEKFSIAHLGISGMNFDGYFTIPWVYDVT